MVNNVIIADSKTGRVHPAIISTGADYAPLEERRYYDIFCFFGSPVFVFKTLSLSKIARKTIEDHFLQFVTVLWPKRRENCFVYIVADKTHSKSRKLYLVCIFYCIIIYKILKYGNLCLGPTEV